MYKNDVSPLYSQSNFFFLLHSFLSIYSDIVFIHVYILLTLCMPIESLQVAERSRIAEFSNLPRPRRTSARCARRRFRQGSCHSTATQAPEVRQRGWERIALFSLFSQPAGLDIRPRQGSSRAQTAGCSRYSVFLWPTPQNTDISEVDP
jgi:hypothetical protein